MKNDTSINLGDLAFHNLTFTRLSDVAKMIRPYRIYAHYGVLYQMAMDGDLPIVRDQDRRIWVIGEAEDIALFVERKMRIKNAPWQPMQK